MLPVSLQKVALRGQFYSTLLGKLCFRGQQASRIDEAPIVPWAGAACFGVEQFGESRRQVKRSIMSDIQIQRGKNTLSDGQLQEYLTAAGLGVENVGVLLGSGASVSAGGRTMEGTWEYLVENHSEVVLTRPYCRLASRLQTSKTS